MDEPRKEPQLRGLYGKVKIPVKVLDTVIVVGYFNFTSMDKNLL